MYKEFDVVRASKDLEEVPKGTLGTILIVHNENYFIAEFLDTDGNSLNVLTVNVSEIEHFQQEGMKYSNNSARQVQILKASFFRSIALKVRKLINNLIRS